jgi:hypothetical protein
MESVSDVAWIIVRIICCPTARKNLDEYYLAWVSECQPVDIYNSGSGRITLLKTVPTNGRPTPRAPHSAPGLSPQPRYKPCGASPLGRSFHAYVILLLYKRARRALGL